MAKKQPAARATRRASSEAPVAGAVDYGALKAGGIIRQRQKDRFTIRLKCPGGRLLLDRLERILAVARLHGGDFVHLSVRQSVEIPHVSVADLDVVKRKLAAVGQEIATCGARVRVPTACAGCEYNPKGLMDTQRAALEVNDRFFGRGPLPGKFKMCFAGCPNDCPHSAANDLGFQGAVEPQFSGTLCTGCGICAEACKEGAIVLDPKTGRPQLSWERCLYCGDCIRSCPTDAWSVRRRGWMVRAGGKHGRHPIMGAKIAAFLPDEKVPELIEAVLAWYERAAAGKGKVRLGSLLCRPVGWRQFLSDLAPVLGQWAARDPAPPQRCEIH